MRLSILPRRSLLYHRWTNLAVLLGVIVGSAALTGALVVGDSMRGSLHDAALGRLGTVDHAVVSHRFFSMELASKISSSLKFDHAFTPLSPAQRVKATSSPAILLDGSVVHADTGARVNRVSLLGVVPSFWSLRGENDGVEPPALQGRRVVLNEPLAQELGASEGDDVLIRVGKPSAIAAETLLGRRDRADTTATLRLSVSAIVPAENIGAFSLKPRQALPRNAYISLSVLQRTLQQQDRINTLLVSVGAETKTSTEQQIEGLNDLVREHARLADFGLGLRIDDARRYGSLESDSMAIEPPLEDRAMELAKSLGLSASPIKAYLVNRMAGVTGGVIPYSTVVAVAPGSAVGRQLVQAGGSMVGALQPGAIYLNQWAADDLGLTLGERVTLEYYVTGAFGQLDTRRSDFELRAILPMSSVAGDAGFVPVYEGITDTQNLSDWDAPFPMDFKKIREKDEQYWDDHGATPKGFISLEEGVKLWSEDGDRFGRYTSIRLAAPANDVDWKISMERFEQTFCKGLNPAQLGLSFEPVRRQLAAASGGSTDFGMLFIGFSFFLIGSAAMLVALLFRLGVEQRAGEIGLLLAEGFAPSTVLKLLVVEGATISVIGGVIGVGASLGYASLMLAGLRSWWSDAVHTPFLQLHVSVNTLIIGFVAGFAVATLAIVWSLRGLGGMSVRALLAGVVAAGRSEQAEPGKSRALRVTWVAGLLAVVCAMLPVLFEAVPPAGGFFGGGACMLVACLAFFSYRLSRPAGNTIHQPGVGSFVRLGVRNARRRRGRSVLTAGLIASATFLISALEAFHLEPDVDTGDRGGGAGGFVLYGEAAAPLLHDLNSPTGREALGVSPEAGGQLAGLSTMAFRFRPGDETGCVNLYRPSQPRILGAPDAMVNRGGFRFASTLADTKQERENPWLLLRRKFEDGAIPVIGDASAVTYQLHLGLGKDLVIQDERGTNVHLRFVALLSNSALQDELIVGEADFTRIFPSIGGYGFFLFEAPPDESERIERILERELEGYSLDVGTTADRLADYLAVQNTYLSTFQTLGGFGLILGTFGMTAVLLRNVWERRSELALLRALGYSRAAIGAIVLSENIVLLLAGLISGAASALLAVGASLTSRVATFPWLSVGMTLAGVAGVGVLAGLLALLPALRGSLVPSLRAE